MSTKLLSKVIAKVCKKAAKASGKPVKSGYTPRGPFVVWFGGEQGWPSGNEGIRGRYRTVAGARAALAAYTKANPLEDVVGDYTIRTVRGRKV